MEHTYHVVNLRVKLNLQSSILASYKAYEIKSFGI